MKVTSILILAFFIASIIACNQNSNKNAYVITSDIDRFWTAFDSISLEPDSIQQVEILESIYLSQGTPGLNAIREAKRYTTEDYINMISDYPKFLKSIRSNTESAHLLTDQLETGIEKLRSIYPELKPAKIYFTIGAMRSGGTAMDSLVLIGSELAMMDETTVITEFSDGMKNWAQNYIATEPYKNIVLLNVHEYVHTQQHPIVHELLSQVLYEGVAEFVSVKAMDTPSISPAVKYGKNNPEVKEVFEKEMFYDWTFQWLWSNNSPRDFNTRDLGYYIGYSICELYYDQSQNKAQAIKEMIELDYQNPEAVAAFVDKSHFFSKPIRDLREEDRNNRPHVAGIRQFKNGSQDVDSNLTSITIEFSEPLSGFNTGVDYGELGDTAFPIVTNRTWSTDNSSWTMEVELKPETRYQIMITNNFRTTNNVALMPYLIDFKTK